MRPTPRHSPPAHETRSAGSGGSRSRFRCGNFVEAPAAALVPLPARREFPKSRPAAGAMMISPMPFIVSRSRPRDRRSESAHSSVRTAFQPQRRRTARPRPERATGERSRRRKPALIFSAEGFSGACGTRSYGTCAMPRRPLALTARPPLRAAQLYLFGTTQSVRSAPPIPVLNPLSC